MSFEAAMAHEIEVIPGLSGKIFPLFAPAGTLAPYVLYESSDGQRDKTIGGYLGSRAVEVELNLIANSYASMKQLTAAIISTIISFQSRSIGTGGPFIQEVTYEEPDEIYESAAKLHRSNIIFRVYFE